MDIGKHFTVLFQSFFYFLTICHVVSCFWIIAGKLDESEKSWVWQYNADSHSDLYLTSFYFTITTITTVGYGDFSANTMVEKVICVFIMIAGVVAFSFASSSLTNYMQTMEKLNAVLDDKMKILDRLAVEHEVPEELYSKIKKSLMSNYVKDMESESNFVGELPTTLREQLSVHIYEQLYTRVDFLKRKD